MGYHLAGFDIIGADIAPQPHYPFEFHQDDALHVLDTLLAGEAWQGYILDDFDAIHASPECKAYTDCNLSPKEKYQMLIGDVRQRLQRSGKLYIIENVRGAKKHMQANVMLCGSMFGLPMQRHRLFETNMPQLLTPPKPCDHRKATIAVYGHSVWDSSLPGTPRKDGRNRPDSVPISVGRKAMGIDWMNIEELAEAIPPAYTQWLGTQLLSALNTEDSEGVA